MKLKRSSDQKVTNHVTASGKVSIKNAFGLPAGKPFSCPGATSICESVCYAGKIEKRYSGVIGAMLHNYDLLKDSTLATMVELLSDMIAEFSAECERKSARKAFRIHWDGDFFSRTYARAWAITVQAFPDVEFWAYTRSFTAGNNVVDLLIDIPNLALYLSVDADNVDYAEEIVAEYPHINVSALSETMTDAGKIIAQLRGDGKPGARCPELIGALPLISPEGSACIRCNLCPRGAADIRFASTPAGRV